MNTATLSLPSPAKLNLMLHILGRREDGYHSLQTLFQFLDYGDQLHLTVRNDEQIFLHDSVAGVPHDDNLIVRATRLLQEHCQPHAGADIRLDKRLPAGAGLGGGSSNAATALLGLNHLWQCGLSLDQLAELGLQLGADVPVFVHGRAAFAEGVGEQLSFVELQEPWFLVVRPPVQISTAKIFSDQGLTRDTPPSKLRTVLRHGGHNDCQATVLKHYPEVASAMALLETKVPAKLTGTGSCIFWDFPSHAEAVRVAALLPDSTEYFVAKGSNTSSTHKALQSLSRTEA